MASKDRALIQLDGIYRSIVLNINKHGEVKDSKEKKKIELTLRTKITEYVDLAVHAVASDAIACDPYGIINGRGFAPKSSASAFARKAVKDTLSKLRERDPEVLSKVDLAEIKAAHMGIGDKIKGKFKNGVKWLFDKETGRLVLAYKGMKRYISMAYASVVNFTAWLKNKIKSLFYGHKETAQPEAVAA